MKFLEIENVEMKMLDTMHVEAHATQRYLLKHIVANKSLRTLMRKKFFIANMFFLLIIIARSNAMLMQFRNSLLNMMLIRQRMYG